MHTSIGVRLNGESIVGGFTTLGDLFNSWWENPLGEGKIEVDIENNNFVTPEGVAGLNTCHTEYDTSRDDYEPPVLRAMRTLNAEEAVVQSFATADEAAAGFVEIAATDLHMNPASGKYDMTLDAPEVKMEYAPYRSDNYKEIAMTENPNGPTFPDSAAISSAIFRKSTKKPIWDGSTCVSPSPMRPAIRRPSLSVPLFR